MDTCAQNEWGRNKNGCERSRMSKANRQQLSLAVKSTKIFCWLNADTNPSRKFSVISCNMWQFVTKRVSTATTAANCCKLFVSLDPELCLVFVWFVVANLSNNRLILVIITWYHMNSFIATFLTLLALFSHVQLRQLLKSNNNYRYYVLLWR